MCCWVGGRVGNLKKTHTQKKIRLVKRKIMRAGGYPRQSDQKGDGRLRRRNGKIEES